MFTLDEALERAAAITGLDDFGDPSFHDGLERLLAALSAEADLTPLGAGMAENTVLTTLRNRLRVEDWWNRHPDLDAEVVTPPIVIVGMSRSGTTALSHLLGQDPALRSLRRWETSDSVPPPEATTYWADPRYVASIEADARSDRVMPGLKALHHDPPDAPVECNSLFTHEFNSTAFPTVYFVPSYFRWMMAADQAPIYAYHERMLKLLQSHAPGQWNLKGPQHGYAIGELRRRYPDAILIATHRDPAVTTASTASLITFLNRITSGAVDAAEVGRVTTEFMVRCADGLVADERTNGGGDAGIIHVPYPQLVADPLGTIRRVYGAMGRELSPEAEAAMKDHIADRPRHKHGVHRYRATDFGLDLDALDERFSTYREVFDVEREVGRA